MPDTQQLEHIFWAYRTAKKAWRRTTRKGARTCRRSNERFSRKGRGKGKFSFPSYFGGEGRGGKSAGMDRKNPKDVL
eukprot:11223158-Lingulodinium_polyedra.AAC.1